MKAIIIPARLESTRLPRKLLLDLKGKSVLQRVYEQCLKVKNADAVYIATDSEEIQEHCSGFTQNIILTSKNHKSGTDRLAEAITKISNYDYVINVQGDEPLIDPKLVEQVIEGFGKEVTMVSAMKRITEVSSLKNPNTVKVITDVNSNAIYFSRLPIPYNRDVAIEELLEKYTYYKHIGIYGYTKEFLQKIPTLPYGKLEVLESLEQLRVLENGYTIKMIETQAEVIGVDTQEDYIKVLQKLEKSIHKQ